MPTARVNTFHRSRIFLDRRQKHALSIDLFVFIVSPAGSLPPAHSLSVGQRSALQFAFAGGQSLPPGFAIGFPIAMLLAWVYEFTPEGVVRTEDLHPAQARSIQRATGRMLDFIIIGALLLVIAMLLVGRLPFYTSSDRLLRFD